MSDIFIGVDYIGTFIFALTGASIAAKSDLDFFGMLFLAFLTAVGGGTVRDIILDQQVFWTMNSIYIYIILIATIISFFSKGVYEKYRGLLLLLDTLGLGLFVVSGTQMALHLGSNYITAIIMGVISGILGGILRSVFSSEVPIIFKKEVYATTAALSSILFIFLRSAGISELTSTSLTLSFCLCFRYLSIKFNLHLPKAR